LTSVGKACALLKEDHLHLDFTKEITTFGRRRPDLANWFRRKVSRHAKLDEPRRRGHGFNFASNKEGRGTGAVATSSSDAKPSADAGSPLDSYVRSAEFLNFRSSSNRRHEKGGGTGSCALARKWGGSYASSYSRSCRNSSSRDASECREMLRFGEDRLLEETVPARREHIESENADLRGRLLGPEYNVLYWYGPDESDDETTD
jgi:hypothetical protein